MLRRRLSDYVSLGKPRLTVLVTLSAMSSYALAPMPLSLESLSYLTLGTLLTSGAANALNQRAEPAFDATMSRTRNRPIVRGKVSKNQALGFAAATTAAGTLLLSHCSPLVAGLGFSNIILYAFIYTPLKRVHIANTWVGSVVGAIPPLMGWSAAGSSLLDPAAWCLAGILFAWQFPHFNSLSRVSRDDYAGAGYKMMAVTHPELNARTALRYSIVSVALSWGLVQCDLVNSWFLLTSLPLNYLLIIESWRFYRDSSIKTARRLFWVSIVWLPCILALAMIQKTRIDEEEEEA